MGNSEIESTLEDMMTVDEDKDEGST